MRLENLGQEVATCIQKGSVLLVSDEHVAPLYLNTAKFSLEDAGFEVHPYVVAAGENSKSPKTYFELLNFMASVPLTRTDCVVALGGGIVGDLAGFAAATYLRGIPVIQVPTSLLAMVDSSVGGKTAINLPAGKNLVGAFHLPALVFLDMDVLKTLPQEYFKDGMGEVIKYGLLYDADLFERLQTPDWTKTHLEEVVHRCIEIKEVFVKEDVFDKGERQKLNLGHTIGHAIERATDFEISHGCAVAIGLLEIAKVAAKHGLCELSVATQTESILKAYGFSLDLPKSMQNLCKIMLADKKRKGNVMDLVMPTAIGSCILKRIPTNELESFLCKE